MSAHDDVMKEINKRAKKFKAMRTNSKRDMSYYDIAFQFFDEVEEARLTATHHHDFDTALDTACGFLDSRFKAFDEDVEIQLMWANESSANWKDITIDRIVITWSRKYLVNYPDRQDQLIIGIGDMFFS